jgi:cysteine desulfurase
VPVDGDGRVDPEVIARAITPETVLISVMHANNEVGTVNPIREIADLAHGHGILMHTDAAQSVGKIPVRIDELNVDLLSVAGHKLYAPKGIGALYVREGVRLEKLIHGAGQERGWRAGTENVILAVGLGEACALIDGNLGDHEAHLLRMRQRLESGLHRVFSSLRIHGSGGTRLPNTSSIGFKGVKANEVLWHLTGVAVSAGAACHSDHVSISHVLKAMGVPMEFAMGTLRFSVGRSTTGEEIDRAIQELADLAALRSLRRDRN